VGVSAGWEEEEEGGERLGAWRHHRRLWGEGCRRQRSNSNGRINSDVRERGREGGRRVRYAMMIGVKKSIRALKDVCGGLERVLLLLR